ncbi:MAG: hypothetical protein HQ522_07090 [Bacteroidetes bacterium]|nr:hypothetical protein [Bacteroidota bacterium]
MELTDLKKTWDKLSSNRELDENQLKTMLGKRTKNLIERIERNIKIGFIVLFVLVFVVALDDFLITPMLMEEMHPIPKWVLFLNVFSYTLIFTTFIYFVIKYYRVKRSCDISCELKDSLKKIIETLNLYQKLFYLALISLTITLVLGFIAGLYQGSFAKLESQGISFSEIQINQLFLEIGIGLAFIVFVVGGIFIFLRWGFRKLYGNYYHKLKRTLRELEEIDD